MVNYQRVREVLERAHLWLVPSYRELCETRRQIQEVAGNLRQAQTRISDLETALREQQEAFGVEIKEARHLELEAKEAHNLLQHQLQTERAQYETERTAIVEQRNRAEEETQRSRLAAQTLEEKLEMAHQQNAAFKAAVLGRWITPEQLREAGIGETVLQQLQEATTKYGAATTEITDLKTALRELRVAQAAFVATISGEYEPALRKAPFAIYSPRGTVLYETARYRRSSDGVSLQVKELFADNSVQEQLRGGTIIERKVGDYTVHCTPYTLGNPPGETEQFIAVYLLPDKKDVPKPHFARLKALAEKATGIFGKRTEQLQEITQHIKTT